MHLRGTTYFRTARLSLCARASGRGVPYDDANRWRKHVMSAPPSIDIDAGPRGQSADDLLESDSPEMSRHEIKLVSSVLVVSAYPDHRAALVGLLVGDGYRVSQAESATDALDKIKGQKFDLVITGIQMRHMDGLELLRIVRERVPSLPVIAIGDANSEM